VVLVAVATGGEYLLSTINNVPLVLNERRIHFQNAAQLRRELAANGVIIAES